MSDVEMDNTTANISNYDYNNPDNYFPTSNRILSYIVISIFPIGIIGNLISLLIFIRPCLNSKTNTGKLYALLCGVNLITIIYEMVFKELDDFFQFRFHLPLATEYLIENILLQVLSWIKALITFDRFIAVVFPIKGYRIILKKWVLSSIILGMFISIIGVNSPNFIRVYTYTVNNETFTIYGVMSDEIRLATDFINFLMQFVIPFVLMLALDIKVSIRLRKLNSDLGERQSRQSTNKNKSSRFSRKTIIIDFIYLFFNFPPTILNIHYILINIFPSIPVLPVGFEVVILFFKLFPHIYSSLLFLLFLIFNRIFRFEFISILRLDKCYNIIKNRLFV